MSAKQPQHFLVETLVFTIPGSKPRVVSYWDPKTDISGKPLKANVGDRIAWTVILVQLNGRNQIPYTVSFFKDGAPDSSFFGVSSLAVPHGGLSEFLTVRSLKGQISYRIDAPGYGCLLDPDIQSGDSSPVPNVEDASDYVVSWDTHSKDMTCKKDGVNTAFPITVRRGDKVSFTITQGSEFEILFAISDNGWGSPFEELQVKFPATAASPLKIGPLVVMDDLDSAGARFPFSGTATNADGDSVTSNSYEIRLG